MVRRFFIIIAIVIIVAIGAIALGFYPVLRINGEWVLQRTVADRLASTEQVFAGQGLEDAVAVFEEQGGDLFLGVLESIIDERLVYQATEELVDDIDHAVQQRVEEAMQEIDIERSIEQAYGISFEAFREQVLEPAAVIDILRDTIGKEALEQRLEEIRLAADVKTYVIPYRWENGLLSPEE